MTKCDFASAAISFLGGFFKAYCNKKKAVSGGYVALGIKRKAVVEDLLIDFKSSGRRKKTVPTEHYPDNAVPTKVLIFNENT